VREALVERAEDQVALILGLEVEPLLHHVAVERQVFAAKLDHPVHHQEVEVEAEQLGVRRPDLREEAVHLLAVVAVDLVPLREPRGVLLDVGGQRGDRELERRAEGDGVHHAHVVVRERGQREVRFELGDQPVQQRFGDHVEELAVHLVRADDHALVGETEQHLAPLAVVAAVGEHQLAVELVGVGDPARLHERRERVAIPFVRGLQHGADARTLGDRAHGELDHAVSAGRAVRLAAQALVEVRDHLIRRGGQPLGHAFEFVARDVPTARGGRAGGAPAGAGAALLVRVAAAARQVHRRACTLDGLPATFAAASAFVAFGHEQVVEFAERSFGGGAVAAPLAPPPPPLAPTVRSLGVERPVRAIIEVDVLFVHQKGPRSSGVSGPGSR
jgi:hypothetical protein